MAEKKENREELPDVTPVTTEADNIATESLESEVDKLKGRFKLISSLRSRLARVFILIAILIPVVVGGTSIVTFRAQLRVEMDQSMRQTASFMREFLAHTMFDRYTLSELLASDDLAMRGIKGSASPDVINLLNEFIVEYRMYSTFAIIDRSGVVRQINTKDKRGDDVDTRGLIGTNITNWKWEIKKGDRGDYSQWFTECISSKRKKPYFTRYVRRSLTLEDAGLEPYNILFAMPIRDKGVVQGCFLSAYKITELQKMYTYGYNLMRRKWPSFELIIIDDNGLVIWENTEPEKAFDKNLFDLNSRIAKEWKTSGQGTLEDQEIHEVTGKDVYTAIVKESGYHEYPGLDWGILARAEVQEVFKPARTVFWNTAGATFILLLIVILIIFWFSSSITNPIEHAVNLIERMGEGDLTRLIRVETDDEVGKLQFFLNQTIYNLRSLVEALKGARKKASDVSVDASNKAREVLRSSQEQAALLEEASASLEELTASTQSIFEATQKQLAGATANSKSMEELKHLFTKTADVQEQITKEADETMQHARSGGAAIELSMQSMKEISDTSQRILGIIDVINDIADQTDLLALNASIEAARAGEHGKGFSVVAQEISELAERSSASAKEIARLLRSANQKVELGSDKVNATREIFQRIVGSMDKLSKDIFLVREFDKKQSEAVIQTASRAGNVADLAREIAEATKLQSQSTEEITEDMARANEITVSNVDQAESLDMLLQNLVGVLDQVSNLVHNFILPESGYEQLDHDLITRQRLAEIEASSVKAKTKESAVK